MQAVRYHEYGDEGVLEIDDIEVPSPSCGEVLVRVQSASVNPVDTKLREGVLKPTGGLPQVAGTDLAGDVVEVGPNVTEFESDDRVFGTGFGWKDQGTYAEYACVPADRLCSISENISYRSAAAAAMIYTTAWRALRDCADISIGEYCLIHGASGGVGHAAVQIANKLGATVIGTCRPGSPTDIVREDGGIPVDYTQKNLLKQISKSANNNGYDVVLDLHSHKYLDMNIKILNENGRIVNIAQGDSVLIKPDIALKAMLKQIQINYMSIMACSHHHKQLLSNVEQFLASNDFKPRIDTVYRLDEAAAAQKHAVSSGTIGKVIIDIKN